MTSNKMKSTSDLFIHLADFTILMSYNNGIQDDYDGFDDDIDSESDYDFED
ncbi:MAG: hypothetical protein K5798_09550 [Nitrosopumilus sp.]|uniref:hypothetical protein n=1 Tax=Nitrosopumilus sp. TaxID=2024843 RepID=UPI00242FC48F|nr:hypothetical protein [Nitrosopumilus sp.]MCV0367488.1 hypothetical protein [Nitrosopumilus sp.]